MILLCTFTIRNIQDLSSNKTVIMIQAGGGLGWGTRLWYICGHLKFVVNLPQLSELQFLLYIKFAKHGSDFEVIKFLIKISD